MENEQSEILKTFEDFQIPLDRKIVDFNTNNYGTKMIEFCKKSNCFILNGRIGSDSKTTRLTCRNSSTVDYALCTASVLKDIINFEILDFCDLYSDVHSPITIEIKTKT